MLGYLVMALVQNVEDKYLGIYDFFRLFFLLISIEELCNGNCVVELRRSAVAAAWSLISVKVASR